MLKTTKHFLKTVIFQILGIIIGMLQAKSVKTNIQLQ